MHFFPLIHLYADVQAACDDVHTPTNQKWNLITKNSANCFKLPFKLINYIICMQFCLFVFCHTENRETSSQIHRTLWANYSWDLNMKYVHKYFHFGIICLYIDIFWKPLSRYNPYLKMNFPLFVEENSAKCDVWVCVMMIITPSLLVFRFSGVALIVNKMYGWIVKCDAVKHMGTTRTWGSKFNFEYKHLQPKMLHLFDSG